MRSDRMTDVTKLAGLDRTKAEQKNRTSRMKIKPDKTLEEVKKKQRTVFSKRRLLSKKHQLEQLKKTKQLQIDDFF